MSSVPGLDSDLGPVLPTTRVVAASAATARERISRVDRFVKSQSRFDRQARLNVPEEAVEVSQKRYLRYLMTQVRPWSAAEVSALTQIVGLVRGRFQGLDVDLPPTVTLVKTTGEEEGYAAYTRGDDTIVLPETKVATLWAGGGGGDSLHPTPSVGALADIVTHEFFHLISKNNPALRRSLYGRVHYQQFDVPLELPEVPWSDGRMPALKITNPDTPELNVFIRMTLPGDTVETPLVPVLLARSRYHGGVFFDYLEWWFLGVRQTGAEWIPLYDANGRPVLVESAVMMGQYMDLIGRNITEEIFHPDEILAQNFVLAMSQPDLSLLGTIQSTLRRDGD